MHITIGAAELVDLDVRVGGVLLTLVLERRDGRLWWALGARHIWWSGVAPVV